MESEKTDLLSLTLPEVVQWVKTIGQPAYRGKQIYQWMYKGVAFSDMVNLPLSLRTMLAEKALDVTITHIERQRDHILNLLTKKE